MLCPVQAKSWKARELEKQNIDHRLDMRWEMGVKVIQTRRKDTLEGKRTADALSDFAYWNWTSTFNFYFWLNNCLSSSILMQSRHFSYLHPNCASSLFTLTSLLHPTLYQALWLLVIRLYSFIHSFIHRCVVNLVLSVGGLPFSVGLSREKCIFYKRLLETLLIHLVAKAVFQAVSNKLQTFFFLK